MTTFDSTLGGRDRLMKRVIKTNGQAASNSLPPQQLQLGTNCFKTAAADLCSQDDDHNNNK